MNRGVFRKWRKLSRPDRLLSARLLVLLGLWRLVTKVIPFSHVRNLIGTKQTFLREDLLPRASLSQDQVRYIRRLSSITARVSARTPWRSTCLAQCFTVSRLLKRKKIACHVLLGVREDVSGRMIAHAWSVAGGIRVTGGVVADAFTVTGIWSSIP